MLVALEYRVGQLLVRTSVKGEIPSSREIRTQRVLAMFKRKYVAVPTTPVEVLTKSISSQPRLRRLL
jgi:hypothetical protein